MNNKKPSVEEVDLNILGVLSENSKENYNQIAKILEKSPVTIKMIEVETEIAENPNVFGVYDITGDYDALVFARFKTRTELSEMIKKLHASPNVRRTNTHLILNVIKEGSSFVKLLDKEKKKK